MSVQKNVLVPYDKFLRWKEIVESCENSKTSIGDQLNEREQNGMVGKGELAPESKMEIDEKIGDSSDARLDDGVILACIPKNMTSRARAILSFLNNAKDKLNWNDRGEISCQGETLKHSHITDLLKDSLREYQNFHPIGGERYYKTLADCNIPLTMIGNSKRRDQIGGYKTSPPREKLVSMSKTGSGNTESVKRLEKPLDAKTRAIKPPGILKTKLKLNPKWLKL
jgi:hypothetical protein